MRFKYRVKARKSWSEKDRNEIRKAVSFAEKTFALEGPGNVLVKFCYFPDEYGSVVDLGDDRFVLYLSAGDTIDRAISTVFHEMWHIHQYIYDGLDMHETYAKFRGTKHKFSQEAPLEEYYAYPWEIEARAVEDTMLKAYTSRKKSVDKAVKNVYNEVRKLRKGKRFFPSMI